VTGWGSGSLVAGCRGAVDHITVHRGQPECCNIVAAVLLTLFAGSIVLQQSVLALCCLLCVLFR
jgi:hypothetical protein